MTGASGNVSQTGSTFGVLLLFAVLVAAAAIALLLPVLALLSYGARDPRAAATQRPRNADLISDDRDAMMAEVDRILNDKVLVRQARRRLRGHGPLHRSGPDPHPS